MNRILMMLAMGAVAAGCCTDYDPESLTKKSPDGRNEITLYTKPLAYEVKRDGVTVVAKTPIGMKIDGKCCGGDVKMLGALWNEAEGEQDAAVYKKSGFDRAQRGAFANFGDWGIELAARNDGVAYRFVTHLPGEITVGCEKATVAVPDAKARCWFNRTTAFGNEETVPEAADAGAIRLGDREMVYLPFVYSVGGKTVAVTESDVHDYPIWNLAGGDGAGFGSRFAPAPKKTQRAGGWDGKPVDKGGRWVKVVEHEDFLVKTKGERTFPWRVFLLADEPSKLCEADAVYALATPAKGDFSWVRPGKVAWDWWNAFDNQGDKGCNTKTYERFIDFAAKNGVEYVIFDEGWSESLNIWKFAPAVDVPHLIDYANQKGVGIILWMAWAQVYGEEERVAEHFAKLGAKGFKVDFMDRGDAEVGNFLEKFAAACAKHRMLVDYHGAYRPVGLHRTYPNVVNYEGVHGLEQMKWGKVDKDMPANDVKAFFLRGSAGPMDYTPGAMDNYPLGAYRGDGVNPGSVGTRCHQMALLVAYEGYLQMLSDSPTKYERNMECFRFMSAIPVVWDATVGLGGCPESFAAVARQAKDGGWYAAAINTRTPRDFTLDTAKFLKGGEWKAEIFRDAPEGDTEPTKYVRETKTVKAGDKLGIHLAAGGGFVVRFSR